MKVLAISRAPWRDDNSTGNTFTDFFRDFSDVEFYSLCMREQPPRNDIAKRHFFISEQQMLKQLKAKETVVGDENSPESTAEPVVERILYDTERF